MNVQWHTGGEQVKMQGAALEKICTTTQQQLYHTLSELSRKVMAEGLGLHSSYEDGWC